MRPRTTVGLAGILLTIAAALAAGPRLAADAGRHERGDVPPLTGVAVARALDGKGRDGAWTLSVTLGREVWQAVGAVLPEESWPEILWEKIPRSTESLGTMTFAMDRTAGSALCRILDRDGRDVGRDRALQELETERRLLVSVSGRLPEPRYLGLPAQVDLIVVLGPEPSGVVPTPSPDADETIAEYDPAVWGEQESQDYFFGLMAKGKTFRVASDAEAGRYLEGLWRLDRRAHLGAGHYVHADRGDDVTVIGTGTWLVTSVFNRHATPVAEALHRIETVTVKSDGTIVVNGSERFKPLDEDRMAMVGYDFIAVVRRSR